MFKRIVIELTGPICNCDKQDLIWGTRTGEGLSVTCKTCKTGLVVPHKKFVARFALDTPYPEDDKGEMLKLRDPEEGKPEDENEDPEDN